MTDYPTDVHAPDGAAPAVSNYVATCAVCGCQWQVRATNKDDARGCSFCDAPRKAIHIAYEGH